MLYLWVVNKGPSFTTIRWKIPGGGILEALDDGLSSVSPAASQEGIPAALAVFPEPLYPTISVKGL